MITPLTNSGEVDHEKAWRLARHLSDNWSDALVVTGTTGESPTLSEVEKVALYKTVVDSVAGKDTYVIAGTGNYDTARELLDFQGELRLQARASQTQTGWKRLVLKIFDPMLDGNGAGTVLPISITGARDQPKFSADIKKAIFK